MKFSPSRFACLLVVGTAGLCLPGAAQAASISFDRPCYRGPMAQNLSFSGLPADSEFGLWQQDPVIYPDLGYVGDVFSGPGGDATRTRTVPEIDGSGLQEVVANLSLRSGEAEVAAGQYRFTALSAQPEIVGYEKPTASISLDVHGFIEGGTLYAHYVHNGRHFKTTSVGALQGPCGTLSKRIAKFPFRPLKKGGWTVQFDNRRSYQHRQYPYVEHQTSVTKTITKKCKRKRGKRCPKPKTR